MGKQSNTFLERLKTTKKNTHTIILI